MKKAGDIYDVCIIGSGFGGCMTAWKLVRAGYRVVMIERGDWVTRGPHNWEPEGSVDLTPFYSFESPIRVKKGGVRPVMGLYTAVGGPSVFYGGVSFRFREADFHPEPEIVTDSGAEWPLQYDDLLPYYDEAEALLDVSGQKGEDPTEPPRRCHYPQPPGPLSPVSKMITEVARDMGLQPFRLPMAINYHRRERSVCVQCSTCDTFACAISAKNDLATCVLPPLLKNGLVLKPSTVAVRLKTTNRRVISVVCFDKKSSEWVEYEARVFILSAGALATPHLILSSSLEEFNPASSAIGCYLSRHMNAIVFGYFPGSDIPFEIFHKQVGIHDFYFGHPEDPSGMKKLGSIQQVHSPPVGLVRKFAPFLLRPILPSLARKTTGLLVMVEDQPQMRNRVYLNRSVTDRFGLPQLVVEHRYSPRDHKALKLLVHEAKKILRRAGARMLYRHDIRTFSHAVGTVRMGSRPDKAPVDANGHFRGLDNLFVADGSLLPTSTGVNPSLTISALALRIGEKIIEFLP